MSRDATSSMPGSCWDPSRIHRHLLWLTCARSQLRLRRTWDRIRSPRRILATLSAGLFLIAYVLYGIFVLSNRAPASPDHLRDWLSGGMVLYALYHAVRCVWTETVVDLELTPAERLWLGGAPLRRSSLATYRISNIVAATAIKTMLLTIVLVGDVPRVELLILGVFSSLLLLDLVRQILVRVASGLSETNRKRAKVVSVLWVSAVALQVIANVASMTPLGSPTWLYGIHVLYAVGDVAQSFVIQVLAVAWIPMAQVAVAPAYSLWTLLAIVCIAITIRVAVGVLVWVDAWALHQNFRHEQALLRQQPSGRFQGDVVRRWGHDNANPQGIPSGYSRIAATKALWTRQYQSVRRYRGTIGFSFLIPTLLCLSPLVTNQVLEQWFYVVSGIALCTMLLAPPALRLDFRRDLLRMQLLKSLPVKPLTMVLGQLALPILITWIFQWVTLATAAVIVQPSMGQWLLWTFVLAALAVFTFATENALFLVYPHHAHQQGLGMMLRAKLTFLGKAGVIAASLALLVLWGTVCKSVLPENWHALGFVGGAIAATWFVAAISVLVTTSCWRRFDLSFDVPPQ
ncbi:hypothetical protein Pla52o_43850 [Novipirellula galeiformis]|uniref:Uncharacterized protein n=1 Tax=Novipirellula galeiformis TaxID=2528004 RepID=A0A5C6C932_9BACT|nr:hypothetical protein [Novipirellula galeiformis]TWU20507.1 hypothetical protein Pla52o_43850 [Novipirellula galeiformis]